uniref:Rev protein n=1 Tax=Caprine arthritis encephalitis virus TaxID=11660 RepID=F6LY15_CAEV|nr:rev protein [Caprine arthritis encephalitis virus]
MDHGDRLMSWKGREQWVKVQMEEKEPLLKEQDKGKYTRKGIQDFSYPELPKGDNNNGDKTRRRRRRNRGWWKQLREIMQTRRANTTNDYSRSLEQCCGAMEQLTMEKHLETEANTTPSVASNSGTMDKWKNWRTPQK